MREKMKLSRKEWSWVIFIPVLLTVMTVGNFIPYIPVYVVAIFVSYLLANKFPAAFNREKYWLFVLKVTSMSVALFFAVAVPYVYILVKYTIRP